MKKVLFVGGLAKGIPQELSSYFEVVGHISIEMGGMKAQNLPQSDFVFVVCDFANHRAVDRVKKRTCAPIIYLKKGWPQMKQRLESMGLLEEGTVRRCKYPPCGRMESPSAPLHRDPFCCNVCANAARRRGIILPKR